MPKKPPFDPKQPPIAPGFPIPAVGSQNPPMASAPATTPPKPVNSKPGTPLSLDEGTNKVVAKQPKNPSSTLSPGAKKPAKAPNMEEDNETPKKVTKPVQQAPTKAGAGGPPDAEAKKPFVGAAKPFTKNPKN